jgi:hypothetical protein
MDINSSTISFRITLIDLNDLKPHEEIIEQAVTELAQAIRDQNEVRDPLIVDKESLVILDGMHRYNALKKLGCKRAPACLVEYDDERITVGAWFRCFNATNPEALVAETMQALNQKYMRKATGTTQTDLAKTAIITNLCEFQLAGELDRRSKSQLAVRIEKYISGRGFKCEYAADNTFPQPNSEANIIIPVPLFSKTEIKETARSGRLLPHKVTRHVIPSRPLRLDIPLDLLLNGTLEEANERLEQLLSSRRVNPRAPGSVVDGRRYQEELLVFGA